MRAATLFIANTYVHRRALVSPMPARASMYILVSQVYPIMYAMSSAASLLRIFRINLQSRQPRPHGRVFSILGLSYTFTSITLETTFFTVQGLEKVWLTHLLVSMVLLSMVGQVRPLIIVIFSVAYIPVYMQC